MKDQGNGYREVLKDDKSLAIFLRKMAKFDRLFCDLMAGGDDFTLRLEIRGDKRKLLSCRVLLDESEQPPGVEKEEQKKGKPRSFYR